MPSGMFQNVGECGWQLSHGERSRIYIARALLRETDLMVLDETFGALDPETMEQALRFVLAHSTTLIVIAHP
jgi:ABC-type multidrug transport system fused ATPase/permease subunit